MDSKHRLTKTLSENIRYEGYLFKMRIPPETCFYEVGEELDTKGGVTK